MSLEFSDLLGHPRPSTWASERPARVLYRRWLGFIFNLSTLWIGTVVTILIAPAAVASGLPSVKMFKRRQRPAREYYPNPSIFPTVSHSLTSLHVSSTHSITHAVIKSLSDSRRLQYVLPSSPISATYVWTWNSSIRLQGELPFARKLIAADIWYFPGRLSVSKLPI